MPTRDPQQAWQHAATIGGDDWQSSLTDMARNRKEASIPDRDASAKSLIDVLGEVLSPSKGSGLPRRLRLTSYNPGENSATLHNVDNGQPFSSTIDDFMKLHRGGELQREGPPTEGLSLASLIKRLTDRLGQ